MFHVLRFCVRTRSIFLLFCFLLCTCPVLWADTIVRDPVEVPALVVGSSERVSVEVFVPVNSQQGIVVIGTISTGSRVVDTSFTVNEWTTKELRVDTTIRITITFSPKHVGEMTDTLFLALPLDTLAVPLFGTGLPLRVAPLELVLGPIREGEETIGKYYVYNDGNSTITVQRNGLFPPFYRDGADSLVIPALDSQAVIVRFAPEPAMQSIPNKFFFGEIRESAAVTAGGSEVVIIRGNSIAATVNAVVNFTTTPDKATDTLIYAFYNRFSELLNVQVSSISGDPGFELLGNYKQTVDVKPGDSLRIPIRFTANGSGRSQTATFRLLYDSEIVLAEVKLQGMSIFLHQVNVVADTLHASVGDTVRIPVRFALTPEMKQVLSRSETSTLDVVYSMSINMSMAEVVDEQSIDSVVYDDSSMVLHIATRLALPLLDNTDTLAINTVAVRLLLGEVERCPIVIQDMIMWVDNAVLFEADTIISSDSRLVADNIFTWPDGQKRLVNTRKGSLEMEISPNPMQEQTQILLSGFSREAVVTIYTPLGMELFRRVYDAPGAFTLTRGDLTTVAPGIYYCRLSSGRYSLVKLLRVE